MSVRYRRQSRNRALGIVELMYSCEWLYSLTGKAVWMDRLEKLAFNALPATLSDDMWTHQYDQMVNQIACLRFPGKAFFRTNSNEANLFGLEPHFGCCTANFNQAGPKLAMNVFFAVQKGRRRLCPDAAYRAGNEDRNARVKLCTVTEYPFRLSCQYLVTVDRPVSFELKIRLPQWTKSVRVNGGGGCCPLVLHGS